MDSKDSGCRTGTEMLQFWNDGSFLFHEEYVFIRCIFPKQKDGKQVRVIYAMRQLGKEGLHTAKLTKKNPCRPRRASGTGWRRQVCVLCILCMQHWTQCCFLAVNTQTNLSYFSTKLQCLCPILPSAGVSGTHTQFFSASAHSQFLCRRLPAASLYLCSEIQCSVVERCCGVSRKEGNSH